MKMLRKSCTQGEFIFQEASYVQKDIDPLDVVLVWDMSAKQKYEEYLENYDFIFTAFHNLTSVNQEQKNNYFKLWSPSKN